MINRIGGIDESEVKESWPSFNPMNHGSDLLFHGSWSRMSARSAFEFPVSDPAIIWMAFSISGDEIIDAF